MLELRFHLAFLVSDLSQKKTHVSDISCAHQVCEKDLYCMDWAVKMMQKVCKVFSTPGERNIFLQSVENAFAHMVMDMLQAVLAGKPAG